MSSTRMCASRTAVARVSPCGRSPRGLARPSSAASAARGAPGRSPRACASMSLISSRMMRRSSAAIRVAIDGGHRLHVAQHRRDDRVQELRRRRRQVAAGLDARGDQLDLAHRQLDGHARPQRAVHRDQVPARLRTDPAPAGGRARRRRARRVAARGRGGRRTGAPSARGCASGSRPRRTWWKPNTSVRSATASLVAGRQIHPDEAVLALEQRLHVANLDAGWRRSTPPRAPSPRSCHQSLHHHHVEPAAELAADLALDADQLEAAAPGAGRSTPRGRRRSGR